MIVDSHTHVAESRESQQSSLAPALTHEWWTSGGTSEELVAALDANGVDRFVIVQAIGAYGYDCSYAAASAVAYASRAAFVAAIDMYGPDPVADLVALWERLPSDTRISGVRLFGVGGVPPTWLTDGRAGEVWEFAAEHNIVIVPTVFASEFERLRSLAMKFPSVSVAIDHCGFTDMVDGDGEALLFALADIPSIHLKVTSYVLEAAERDAGDAAPLVERLAHAFGVNRLCWGSDHPQDQHRDYAGKLALARHATRTFDVTAREEFFANTSSRLFFTS